MVIYLLYSDDNGQTWSKPVLISDTVTSARGNVNMRRDPVTGNILFAWLDARDQADQANVNTFMAIMTKQELDKLPCIAPKCPAKKTEGLKRAEDVSTTNTTDHKIFSKRMGI